MGYESRLIVGEVFGNRGTPMPEDPCPMWMNPIAEVSLSKMAHDGEFARVRQKAKFAGTFIYRIARLEEDQVNGLGVAINVIADLAPDGSFGRDVPWWVELKNLAEDEKVETKEWEDSYGEPFRRLPFRDTVDALRKDWEGEPYRRCLLAADLLDHFIRGFDSGDWREYDPTKDGTDPIGKIMLIHEGY